MKQLQPWIIGMITTVVLSWAAWASTSIIDTVPRTEMEQRLQRIEDKIDLLLQHWRP